MKPLISVIVPVYNVEQYLRKCLDSVISQTYTNLEIILVDDGSTDLGGRICDEYACQDNRITVIHKVNGGLGFARNSGLEICTGEYVMFVDSDDWLAAEAVQVLYDRIVADGSELAIGKHIEIYEDGSVSEACWEIKENKSLTKDDVLGQLYPKNILPVAAWGKLYKKSIFNDIRYTSVCIAEDLFLFPYIIERCGKISISTEIIYYYFQRSNSLMRQKSEKAKFDHAQVTLHIAQYLYENGYIQRAKEWYATAVGRIIVIKSEEERLRLLEEYFADPTKRALLKDANLRTRIKWFELHVPVLVKLRGIYKDIKRGVRKKR